MTENIGLQRVRENAWVGYCRLNEELILALRQGDKEKVAILDNMIKEWKSSTISTTHPWMYSEEYMAEMRRGLQ